MQQLLNVGETALFKHCDMGVIEIQITKRLPKPMEQFYTGILKQVQFKEVRLWESAMIAKSTMNSGKEVNVFVQPHELIQYQM